MRRRPACGALWRRGQGRRPMRRRQPTRARKGKRRLSGSNLRRCGDEDWRSRARLLLGEHRQAKHLRRKFADRLGDAVLVSLDKMLKQRPASLKRRRNDHEQLKEGGFLVKV